MKYSELGLDNRLFSAIEALGYAEATPIQEQVFNPIVQGKDVAGLAQTGTGKTAAFLVPLIERILKAEVEPQHERAFTDWKPFQSVLILVPTRELAEQIHENIQKLVKGTSLKSFPLYGGTGYDKQKEALAQGLHFIVSTPGRLIDLYKEHIVDFKKVRAVVFDEADRMFDMGFKDDMKYILSRIDRQRQFLVFSATLNFDVLNTAYQFGAEPVEINISKDEAKAENVKDVIIHLGSEEKAQHLLSIFKKDNPKQTIIFTNFKNSVERIANFLTQNGIPAMGISSLNSQGQRNQVIAKFKATNNQNVLVATDVAARGLDISDVDLVINYELPQDAESYVHRIGRTGRAGKEGKAVSLVSDKDVESLGRIEEYTKKKIQIDYLEDADLIKDFKPMSDGDSFYRKSFDRGGDRQDRKGRGGRQDRGGRPERDGRGERDGSSRAGGSDRGDRGAERFQGKNKSYNDRGDKTDRNDRSARFERKDKFNPQGEAAVAQQSPAVAPHSKKHKSSHSHKEARGPAGVHTSKSSGPRQQHRSHRVAGNPRQQPGLMKKVSNFFKRLFS